jgi:hypothetical protein
LFRAKSSGDLRGSLGGASSGAVSGMVLDLDGKGGLVGSVGGASRLDLRLTFGAEMDGRRGTRGSLIFFFSGSGGSVAGSYSGALTRNFAPFTWLFPEAPDKEDRAERVEDRDSPDSCLVKDCSDVLRGGKTGGALSVGRRGGNEGRASSSRPSHFLITGGGNRSFSLLVEADRCSPGLLGNGGGALAFWATAWS